VSYDDTFWRKQVEYYQRRIAHKTRRGEKIERDKRKRHKRNYLRSYFTLGAYFKRLNSRKARVALRQQLSHGEYDAARIPLWLDPWGWD